MSNKSNYISLYQFMKEEYYNTELINNLNIISSIKIGDKLYFDKHLFKIDDRYIMPIRRLFDGSSRTDTINHLEYFYESIFEKIKKFKNSFELKSNTSINNLSINNYINILSKSEVVGSNFRSHHNIDDIILRNLLRHLKQSLNGIYNLKITYIDDIYMVDKINILIRKITNILETQD
jgi:hypothetical protein